MTDRDYGHVHLAKRELHRQEMNELGHELAWLTDPDQIPDEAVSSTSDLPLACWQMANWMLRDIGEWSKQARKELKAGQIFKKHELSLDERVSILGTFRDDAHVAYAPGMAVVSEIYSVVPMLATRAGLPRESWSDIAAKAVKFGEMLSFDGTDVQSIIRDYLKNYSIKKLTTGNSAVVPTLDPAKMKLDDETGITTVIPFEELLETTKETYHNVFAQQVGKVCVALQARPKNSEEQTFFHQTWSAFGGGADRLIYPTAVLPVEDDPIPHTDMDFAEFAQWQVETMVKEGSWHRIRI